MKKYITITAAIILFLIIVIFIPGIRDTALNPFQKQSLQSRTLNNLDTIKFAQYSSTRYRYKNLFPFDFVYGEPVWGTLLYKNERFLTEEDKLNKEFYYQCREIGLDINKNNYFFTITAVISAGLDMEPYMDKPVISFNESEGLIVLKDPKSEILTIEIEDNLKESDFPNVEISPGEWQKLITLLLPKIESEVINTGILDSASKNNRGFIEKLFLSIGWQSVEFK